MDVSCLTASLAPVVELIQRHVFGAERLHGDDTTVPVLAKGKTITGRVCHPWRPDRWAPQLRPDLRHLDGHDLILNLVSRFPA
jgi:hypothetical protein